MLLSRETLKEDQYFLEEINHILRNIKGALDCCLVYVKGYIIWKKEKLSKSLWKVKFEDKKMMLRSQDDAMSELGGICWIIQKLGQF